MRELSRESGVPIPTIKFYIREGLLPPGEHLAAKTSPSTATATSSGSSSSGATRGRRSRCVDHPGCTDRCHHAEPGHRLGYRAGDGCALGQREGRNGRCRRVRGGRSRRARPCHPAAGRLAGAAQCWRAAHARPRRARGQPGARHGRGRRRDRPPVCRPHDGGRPARNRDRRTTIYASGEAANTQHGAGHPCFRALHAGASAPGPRAPHPAQLPDQVVVVGEGSP
ncbi:MAG: hypothetical protein U5Q44_04185 [Dehalococcoidia bacterium]|nr:hypothetical protein [Dehalococcoidia bacterium]